MYFPFKPPKLTAKASCEYLSLLQNRSIIQSQTNKNMYIQYKPPRRSLETTHQQHLKNGLTRFQSHCSFCFLVKAKLDICNDICHAEKEYQGTEDNDNRRRNDCIWICGIESHAPLTNIRNRSTCQILTTWLCEGCTDQLKYGDHFSDVRLF